MPSGPQKAQIDAASMMGVQAFKVKECFGFFFSRQKKAEMTASQRKTPRRTLKSEPQALNLFPPPSLYRQEHLEATVDEQRVLILL